MMLPIAEIAQEEDQSSPNTIWWIAAFCVGLLFWTAVGVGVYLAGKSKGWW